MMDDDIPPDAGSPNPGRRRRCLGTPQRRPFVWRRPAAGLGSRPPRLLLARTARRPVADRRPAARSRPDFVALVAVAFFAAFLFHSGWFVATT